MISFRDPAIHAAVTLPAVIVLFFLVGGDIPKYAAFFWIGWEMGQKGDPDRPVLSRLRPFNVVNHPQSFAEWLAPTLASIVYTVALAAIFGGG